LSASEQQKIYSLPHSKPLHHTTNNPNELADVKKTKVKYAKLTKSTPVRVLTPDRGRGKVG